MCIRDRTCVEQLRRLLPHPLGYEDFFIASHL
jgi:hypothetical protein